MEKDELNSHFSSSLPFFFSFCISFFHMLPLLLNVHCLEQLLKLQFGEMFISFEKKKLNILLQTSLYKQGKFILYKKIKLK